MFSPVNYFIGDYLREEKDVVNQFRIRMVFNLVLFALLLMAAVLTIYLVAGYGISSETIRTSCLIILFSSSLFYLKIRKSIYEIAHLTLWLSLANYFFNLIFLFQRFDAMMTLLAAINIIFAFHILGQRWGIIYFLIHFIPSVTVSLLNYYKIKFINYPTHLPNPVEQLLSVVLVSLILIYLIYQYQEAFRVSKIKLEETLIELQRAKYLAEEMNRLKTNFLSNMSHEIRTPINGILGISQIIEMESRDPSILQYIEIQKQSGKRLLNTITSILNLSRLESDKEQLKLIVVNINKVVSECAQSLQSIAHNKGLSYDVAISTTTLLCLSDEMMLKHVITNVIDNAIKFTETGGIRILTSLSTHIPNHISISIFDTGIGISKDFLPKLFNPFEQESTGLNRGYEGTGLGLPISKRYIELLGGELNVSSEKNKGSTFLINLPRYMTTQ